MHEWALAEAVLSAASEVADKENLKEVFTVKLRVGEFQQIDDEILKFALSQLRSGKFSNAKFSIRHVNARLKCKVCGQTWFFRKGELDKDMSEAIHFVPEIAHTYVRCPNCKSPDFEIIEGRGIWLESVRGAK